MKVARVQPAKLEHICLYIQYSDSVAYVLFHLIFSVPSIIIILVHLLNFKLHIQIILHLPGTIKFICFENRDYENFYL